MDGEQGRTGGIQVPGPEAFVNPGRSVGAAENTATLAGKFPDQRTTREKIADSLTRWTSAEDLLMNRAGPRVRSLYETLMPNLSRTGGRVMRAAEDAYSFMRRATETDHANMRRVQDQTFDAWLKEQGHTGVWLGKKQGLREEFSKRVDTAIGQPDTANGSQAITAAADALREGYRKKLQEAKAAGVEWAKDVPEDDFYRPFSIQKHAYYEVTATIGRDGLLDVIKQAFLRAQPDLYRAENAKRPNTKGRARAEDARDRKVTRLAERYLDMLERTQIDNLNAERMAGLGGDSATALRNILSDDGVSEKAIAEVMDAFGYTQKEGPANFRRRAVLERKSHSFRPSSRTGRTRTASRSPFATSQTATPSGSMNGMCVRSTATLPLPSAASPPQETPTSKLRRRPTSAPCLLRTAGNRWPSNRT